MGFPSGMNGLLPRAGGHLYDCPAHRLDVRWMRHTGSSATIALGCSESGSGDGAAERLRPQRGDSRRIRCDARQQEGKDCIGFLFAYRIMEPVLPI